jgi:molybdopterin converting factor small subunit
MAGHITVKLFATLSQFTPGNADHYPVEPGITVRDLVQRMGVSEKEARLIFINGKKAELSFNIQNGDRVGIFPPVGGG